MDDLDEPSGQRIHIAAAARDPGLIASIAALIAAGLTGIAAIIKAWAQLLYARADMIRARAGAPAAPGEQADSEPPDGPGRSNTESNA
ncbi:hypothetical protein ACFQMH_30980 [Streptomyces viridiviolaceus]|uniref:Uncharacterized protein n=1 Tax=Streptomyces viridiviolaceus TaxID=68282 RepID=A0ABW2E7R2_9ACTN|nr:hypothetical protein [Streptomyces viridiviolaceus]